MQANARRRRWKPVFIEVPSRIGIQDAPFGLAATDDGTKALARQTILSALTIVDAPQASTVENSVAVISSGLVWTRDFMRGVPTVCSAERGDA